MEIKSRELLPGEAISLEEEFDPKDDLIRRLLEYKRFRDASRRFERHEPPARAHDGRGAPDARAAAPAEDEEGVPLDLDNVEIWALTGAFAKLLEETGGETVLQVGVEKRNVRFYTERVLERLQHGAEARFSELFERGEGRWGLIGTFVACLELMKQGFLRARQEDNDGEIFLYYKGPADLTADAVAGADEERDEPEESADAPAPELPVEGSRSIVDGRSVHHN